MTEVKKNKNEVAVIEPIPVEIYADEGGAMSPMALMTMAMDKNLDLDRIERLLKFQAEAEAREAQKAFTKAMAEFKKVGFVIQKDLKNIQYNSEYASDGAINKVAPVLARYGISHSFTTEQKGGEVWVTCILQHSEGGSKSVTQHAPPDKSGAKNTIQQFKSTRTYLRKTTLEDVLGIATASDSDDDGNGYSEPVEVITVDQVTVINDLITITGKDKKAMLDWCKVDNVEDIPENYYNRVVEILEAKK